METVIDGFARCVNPDCGELNDQGELITMFDVDRPMKVVKDVKQIKGTNSPGDLFSNMVLQETEYFHPLDDSDLECPTCGFPCALLPEKPITFRKQYGDYAAR